MDFKEIYSEDREKKTEEHLRKVWKGEIRTTYSCIAHPAYRQVEDTAEYVRLAVQNILENGQYPGYNPPRLIADFGTVSMASGWGGKIHLPECGCKYIDPIVHNAEEAQKVFPLKTEGDVQKALKLYGEVCRELGSDRLYCTTIDFQGPLNTAALLWEQSDFMAAMYEEPDAVHAFLEKVTDYLIETIRKLQRALGEKICGNVWPYIWLPSDIGVGITEDYMPLLSADTYREFGIPYVERISREFGGLFIHCCGEYEHQINNLRNSDIHILGLEFHYPHTRPEVLFEAFGGEVLFVPYLAPRGEDEFKTRSEYLQYIKRVEREDTRLWFIIDPGEKDFQEQLALVEEMVNRRQGVCSADGI